MIAKKKILFTGAHTDDIELGCGGILTKVINQKYDICYLTFSNCRDLPRNKFIVLDQNRIQEFLLEKGVQVIMEDFANRRFDSNSYEIRQRLQAIKESFNPDFVFTHWRGDQHQDHEVLANNCLRIFKDQTVIEYETLRSSFGFNPNLFIPITESEIEGKFNLLSLYESQKSLYYFSLDLVRSHAVFRGCPIGSQYAEAFYSSKIKMEFI